MNEENVNGQAGSAGASAAPEGHGQDGAVFSIEVDMDKACRVCGKPGVVEKSGACMACTAAAMRQLGHLEGGSGEEGGHGDLPVQAGEVKDVPWPKLKKVAALIVESVEPGWCLRMEEKRVPRDLRDVEDGIRHVAGWCGRNPLEEFEGPWNGEINAGLVYFERKPPAALVKATVDRELAEYHRAKGFKAGKGAAAEIKAGVIDALTAGAQWKPSSNRVVFRTDIEPGGLVYTDATGGNALDEVVLGLCAAGFRVRPVTPEMMLAQRMAGFDKREPCAWAKGRCVCVGVEFLTWAVWRLFAGACSDDETFGLDAPFVTVSRGSREEIKAGGERSPVAMLRESLAGGRMMSKLKLMAGNVRMALNDELRLSALSYSYDEPESAYEHARLGWRALELVFERYAAERSDAEGWKRVDAGISDYLSADAERRG